MEVKEAMTFAHLIHDPHQFLGLHPHDAKEKIIRLYRPGAQSVHLELFGSIVEAKPLNNAGYFACFVPHETTYKDYRIFHQNGLLAHDPYAFTPTFGAIDAYLFNQGVHYRLYSVLGAHLCEHQGIRGAKWLVWAPNAKSVSLVADFNFFDGRLNPMRSMGQCGVWELFVPAVSEGEKYKFEIRTSEGKLSLKSDPFATSSQLRPATASLLCDVDHFSWSDEEWMNRRGNLKNSSYPLNIYEVHLGSWKRDRGRFANYKQLALELAGYCKEMGFSHVELMPVMEHPLDESWGYQVTGFFAASSRYGTAQDFQAFVNHLHNEGIGVIIDWVPAHFPTDEHSLARFDGSYLFEHHDARKGYHPHWGTFIFNYGRYEVSNFLIASALFWCDKMHIDGLRVDAVASLLYLDYGRREGEWIPNVYGGKENLEAIEFLKHLNAVLHEKFPSVLTFAEESTAYRGVTHPLEHGGLGFDYKWNMGWMNDTLRYFQKETIHRSYHQNDLTFGLLYAFSEKFILPFSHDEVVHGKAALLSKMPGDEWQKFANLRLLYSYMMCQPGKKLIFMGAELGQWKEWNSQEEISWELLQYDRHQKLQYFFKQINHFYHAFKPLWERDFDFSGFEWVDFSDHDNCTISYLRKAQESTLLCVHNFSPNYVPIYFLKLYNVCHILEVFNSDREEYGGSGKINKTVSIAHEARGIEIKLAPLATMIFEVKFS